MPNYIEIGHQAVSFYIPKAKLDIKNDCGRETVRTRIFAYLVENFDNVMEDPTVWNRGRDKHGEMYCVENVRFTISVQENEDLQNLITFLSLLIPEIEVSNIRLEAPSYVFLIQPGQDVAAC